MKETHGMNQGNGYIGRIAEAAGVPAKTIRYYEEIGLMPKTERTESGYRVYSKDMVDRLCFIKKAQHLGLSLSEIQDILDLGDRGRCPCGHVEKLLKKQLQDIRDRIKDLQGLQRRIQRALRIPSPSGAQPKGKAVCQYIEKASVSPNGKSIRRPLREKKS